MVSDGEWNDACQLEAVAQGGKTIVFSTLKGNIKVWDVGLNKIVKEWIQPDTQPGFAISPDDQFLAVAGWQAIYIHAIEGWQVKQVIEVDAYVWCMSFSPAGDKLACDTSRRDIFCL